MPEGCKSIAGLIATMAVAGCAARTPGPTDATPCPDVAGSEIERVCREERSIRTLQARFRADVVVDGETQSTDGVLLVRRPDALRVKMFGVGGMTVHDALWVGDATGVRGRIERPLSGDPIDVRLAPGEGAPAEPEAGLSLLLWFLWRPRCASEPTPVGSEPGWLRLDPDSAHALARDVRVGALGVDEERIVLAGARPDEVVVRYAARDCGSTGLLPRRIEMTSRERGWHATVRILDQEENVALDDGLFVLPSARAVRRPR